MNPFLGDIGLLAASILVIIYMLWGRLFSE